MTGSRSYRALGHRFTIEADSPVLLAHLRTVFFDLAADDQQAAAVRYDVRRNGEAFDITASGEVIATGVPEALVPGWIGWDVNRHAVEDPTDRLFLHAAGAVVDGATVVVAGESGAGKSSLAWALVAAGAAYVTDEAVALRRSDLTVAAFHKPLGIGEAALFPASGLGPLSPGICPPPRVVLLVRYDPGSAPDVVPLTPAALVFRLAELTFGFAGDVVANLETLVALAASATGGRLPTDDLDRAVEAVHTAVTSADRPDIAAPDVREHDGIVVAEIGDEAVVYVTASGSLHHLDTISRLVWATLREGGNLTALATELAARFDAAADRIEADLRTVADHLASEGVLR